MLLCIRSMKPGELPAMVPGLPTRVETPSNPALAFSGVTHEPALPPTTVGLGTPVNVTESKSIAYQAPRNPESGRRYTYPRVLTNIPEYANEVPAMEANSPTRVGTPSNPTLAFSQVTHEAAPSPLVVPQYVRTTPPQPTPTSVDTTGPSPVVTPAPRPIEPPRQPTSIVVDTTSPSPVVTDTSPVNTKPYSIYVPRNPESGRKRIKVKRRKKNQ